MKNRFTISEAAALADMTSETLRHYDRIGLVKPGYRDAWTGYRYYTQSEIVRLRTVQALRVMDLSLKEIQEILEYDDLERIIDFLKKAERKADDKIQQMRRAKKRILAARADYESKLRDSRQERTPFTRCFDRRAILLSPDLEKPTVDILWQYHRHFFGLLPEKEQDAFSFEEAAGIYTVQGISRMFAVCGRYPEGDPRVITLPAGIYLCVDCSEEERETAAVRLARIVGERYGIEPSFVLHMVVVSGILQWHYQVQVYTGERTEESGTAAV